MGAGGREAASRDGRAPRPDDEEEDALLRSLEPKGAGEEGDWLENPIAAPAENADELDVPIEDAGLPPGGDADGDVTHIFQRSEGEEEERRGGWEGAFERRSDDDAPHPRKATLPGLPASVAKKSKTTPPPGRKL
jgi:hypothetical protein